MPTVSGNDNSIDTVVVNGSDSDETFNVSAETRTVPGSSEPVERLARGTSFFVDVFNASPVSGGDTATLNTLGGADAVNVLGIRSGLATTVNGGNGDDTFSVGNLAPAISKT